jgi:hypothetical protein
MNILFEGIKVFNETKTDFEVERIFFENNDYIVIKNILTNEIKEYLFKNIEYDKSVLDDKLQFYREHNKSESSDMIHKFYQAIKPFYEYVLDKKLTKFLGFAMKYNENSDLKPHYDNYNMPISSSICYYNEDNIEYPIFIDKAYFNNPHPFRLTVDDKKGIPPENIIKIDATDGDIVIFRGRNHLHWRDLKYVKDFRALLLHTEDYTYNGKLISYMENSDTITKVNIHDIKNINIHGLTDINSYDTFRKNYVMHFKNS